MSDLMKQLLTVTPKDSGYADLGRKAAAEIERLTTRLAEAERLLRIGPRLVGEAAHEDWVHAVGRFLKPLKWTQPANSGQFGECNECHAAYFNESDIGIPCQIQYCRGRVVRISGSATSGASAPQSEGPPK